MSPQHEIYLDNSATTRICSAALRAYVEASEAHWGNPSSRHSRGKDAEDLIAQARDDVRAALGTKEGSVVFCAGGTEANNLALFGRAYAKPRYLQKNGKILTTAGEHSSVTRPLEALSQKGFRVVEIATRGGQLDMEQLAREMDKDVILVSMMLVNNETGARYDLAAVSRLMHAHAPEAVLHVDATQAFMKFPFTVRDLGADMVTLSSHKIEGPKGVGALWVSAGMIRNRGIVAQALGGGQEGGLRSGTENVPGIAAFGAAVRDKREHLTANEAHLEELRRYLIERATARAELAELQLNLPPVAAPHIVSITLPSIKSETMLHFLSSKGIYVSSGSACSSHDAHLSGAMLAWGLSEREADCTIRVSFGSHNTRADVDALLDALAQGLKDLIRHRG